MEKWDASAPQLRRRTTDAAGRVPSSASTVHELQLRF